MEVWLCANAHSHIGFLEDKVILVSFSVLRTHVCFQVILNVGIVGNPLLDIFALHTNLAQTNALSGIAVKIIVAVEGVVLELGHTAFSEAVTDLHEAVSGADHHVVRDHKAGCLVTW